MKRSILSIAVLCFALTIFTGAVAFAADLENEAALADDEDLDGDDTGGMDRYYVGPGNFGEFPGTLVCLNCDSEGKVKSKKGGNFHALQMEDGIHPLVTGDKESQQEVNDPAMNGKKVTVTGKYYVETGSIYVNKITPRK